MVVMVKKQVPLAYWRTAFYYRNSGRNVNKIYIKYMNQGSFLLEINPAFNKTKHLPNRRRCM